MPRTRALAILAAGIACLGAGPAAAATFTVNSTGDAGDVSPGDGLCRTNPILPTCTLRAAIEEANMLFGPDQVTIPPGVYATGSPLTVTAPVTIVGRDGARTVTIDGPTGVTDEAFDITGAGVTVRGVTVTGSRVGVRVAANDTTFEEVTVTGNTNAAVGSLDGAGIVIGNGGRLRLVRSTVAGNTVQSGNSGLGAGILVGAGGHLDLLASTIRGNSAHGDISAFGGGVTVRDQGTATIWHTTFFGNSVTAGSSASYGGNLYVGGQVTIGDSLFAAGQAGGSGPNCASQPSGSTVLQGRNLDSGTSCAFPAGHLSNANPQLLPFGDHGGPTDTAPPAAGSPAIDAALTCPAGGLAQRREAAPAGPACDIGAPEVGADLAASAEQSRPTAVPGSDTTFTVRIANTGLDGALNAGASIQLSGAAAIVAVTPSSGTCTPALQCSLGTLPAGQTATVTVVATAAPGGPLGLSATATASTGDPNPANNTAALSAPDRTGPAIGALAVLRPARVNRTSRVRLRVSETATVVLRVERVLPGRRVGKVCRVGRRTGARCSAFVLAGTVRRTVPAGLHTVTIPARLRGRRLPAGRYRLTATATDPFGNVSTRRTLFDLIDPRGR